MIARAANWSPPDLRSFPERAQDERRRPIIHLAPIYPYRYRTVLTTFRLLSLYSCPTASRLPAFDCRHSLPIRHIALFPWFFAYCASSPCQSQPPQPKTQQEPTFNWILLLSRIEPDIARATLPASRWAPTNLRSSEWRKFGSGKNSPNLVALCLIALYYDMGTKLCIELEVEHPLSSFWFFWSSILPQLQYIRLHGANSAPLFTRYSTCPAVPTLQVERVNFTHSQWTVTRKWRLYAQKSEFLFDSVRLRLSHCQKYFEVHGVLQCCMVLYALQCSTLYFKVFLTMWEMKSHTVKSKLRLFSLQSRLPCHRSLVLFII